MARRAALHATALGYVALSRRGWAAGSQTANPAELVHRGDESVAEGSKDYIGVAPGSENKNPLPKAETDRATLVWTGFQPSHTGGRVFLQTTHAVTYDTTPTAKQLSVTLRNCRIHLKNNERDLNTSFFDTPVAGVKVRQHRKDVEVTIALKTAVVTSPRVEDGPDGTKFVVLDFAAKT